MCKCFYWTKPKYLWVLSEKEGIYIVTIHSEHGELEYTKIFEKNSESSGFRNLKVRESIIFFI